MEGTYGRSDLEIWIDHAVAAEKNAAEWTTEWRTFPGGAQVDRQHVITCQRKATCWTEIAEFCLAEAEQMEANRRYSPDGIKLMSLWYRASQSR